MDRHSEKVDAALWALLKQGKGPKYILEALAEDECGIGYPVDLKRSTFYDRKRKLIRRFGDPAATVDPGEEDNAVLAIRREALGAIRATVRKLRSKSELTRSEAATLDVCLKAIDGTERRRRDEDINRKQQRRTDKREASESELIKRLTKDMREPVAAGSKAEQDEAPSEAVSDEAVSSNGASSNNEGRDATDSLAQVHTPADPDVVPA